MKIYFKDCTTLSNVCNELLILNLLKVEDLLLNV